MDRYELSFATKSMATSTLGRICISYLGFSPETKHCLYILKLWMFYYALSFVCPSYKSIGLYLPYKKDKVYKLN